MLNGKKVLVTVGRGCYFNNGSRILLTMQYVSSDVWTRGRESWNSWTVGAVVVLLFGRRAHLTVGSAAHQMLCCVLLVVRM